MEHRPLRGRHSEVARAALRLAPPIMRGEVLRLQSRQARCGSPRPGGAARRSTTGGALASGAYVSVVKRAMSEGGDIEIVVSWKSDATLCGDQLRLLRHELPSSVLASAGGRTAGDLIDLSACGEMAALADAKVISGHVDQGHSVLVLDLADAPVDAGETGADHGTGARP